MTTRAMKDTSPNLFSRRIVWSACFAAETAWPACLRAMGFTSSVAASTFSLTSLVSSFTFSTCASATSFTFSTFASATSLTFSTPDRSLSSDMLGVANAGRANRCRDKVMGRRLSFSAVNCHVRELCPTFIPAAEALGSVAWDRIGNRPRHPFHIPLLRLDTGPSIASKIKCYWTNSINVS